ncbi:plasmalemma vesicle associated protein a [Polymixia lowei]
MYSGGYSQVSKFSLEAQKKIQHRSKGKSCGYYMRIVFFFSSLIQSLIIVSLVLFLVYGKQQDSASTGRIEDLEQSFSRLSIENVALRQQRKNLTVFLNVTLTAKMRNDWDLARLRYMANVSITFINELTTNLNQCNLEKFTCMTSSQRGNPCLRPSVYGDCGMQAQQLNAMIELVQTNFTQTTQVMRREMEQIAKERDNINLDAIRLRRDKSILEKEMETYRAKCKEEFTHALSGISNVSRAFLGKIDTLFPRHIPFQLTCQKQRENLEQIRNNCTSLSREVEDKFQRYLDNVGGEVSRIQIDSSRLKAENLQLSEDYRRCNHNRTGMIQEHRQNLQKVQLRCDQEKERLLLEKTKLSGGKDLLDKNINVKDKEIQHLKEQIKQLNISCIPRTGLFQTGGMSQPGSPWSKPTFGGASSPGTGSDPFNRMGSTGPGLNRQGVGSSSNSGSTGSSSTLFKPGSNGVGTSSFGSNRLGSTNVGSTSLDLSRFGSTGLGSTGTGAGKKPGSGLSTGFGSNNLGNTGTGSTGLGGAGAAGRTGSGTWPGTGFGSSNTGQSKLGTSSTGQNRGSSTTGLGSTGTVSRNAGGSSSSGTFGNSGLGRGTAGGSSSGGAGSSGRTGGSSSGSGNVFQHLQDLRRLANPSEEKKDASRASG